MKISTRFVLGRFSALALTATLIGLGVQPSARAGNGTTQYIDVNGTTAGFGTPSGTINQTDTSWSTDATGVAAPVAFATGDAMTFGAVSSDLGGATFTVNLNGGNNLNGVIDNAANCNITLSGSANTHITSSSTWSVTNGTTILITDNRQQFDSGSTVKGFNWNNQSVTFTGPGTLTFQTPLGCNAASAAQTESMNGGTINLSMSAPALNSTANTYKGGFTLTQGTLNFASAGSAYQFSGLTNNQTLSLNGGTIDNTSGSPLLLSIGTYSGAVGGWVKLGGNFTFTGTSTLDFGTVAVTNSISPVINVVANTLAFGGVVSGVGNGLTKTGNGTLLLYGVNNYTGNTYVNKGTLALTNAGSITTSPLLAVSNANFDVTGLVSGTTALTAYAPTNSTLTVAVLGTSTTNVMTTTLTPGGTTNIVNVTSLPLITSYPQVYHIVKGVALVGTLNFGLGTLPSVSPAFTGYITDRQASGTVDLVLTGGPAPVRSLLWTGTDPSNPNNWDVLTSMNWIDTGNGNVSANFNQGDIARFDDTATGPANVNVAQAVQPGAFIISNNVLAYVFNGSGSISGTTALMKQGSGTALLQETGDSFAGGMNVNGGTLIIDTDTSGTTGGAVIGAGGTIQVGTNDTAGVLPSGTVTDNGTLVFNRQDDITVANAITGSGAVSEINSNVVLLSGTSSGNWVTMIAGGTVQALNNSSLGSLPGGAVTITNGGTFDIGPNTTQNNANFATKQFNIAGGGVGNNGAIINSGTVQQQNAFQAITLTANSTIGGANRWDLRGGTPQLNLGGFTLTKTNANQISLVSPHVTAGNIVIGQGTLGFEATPSFDAGASTITVNSGGYVEEYRDTAGSFTRTIILNGGGNTNLSGAGQTAILDAPITLTANSTFGSTGGTEFFNGIISDGGLGYATSWGGGTNLLTAANTYSGTTYMQGGVIGLTNHGSLLNTATIIVNNGGGFDVSGLAGSFSGTNTLWVGDDTLGQGTFTIGKTYVTNFNSLSLSNAILNMAVPIPGVAQVTVTNLDLGDAGASSVINVTALPVLLSTTQFPLIKYANATGTYNLIIGTLPPGYTGLLVNNTDRSTIDLQITGFPSGIWNGASSTDNNWSDSANWNGTALTGNDALDFTGTARLNNTNDVSFTETASSITYLAGAGAFTLNGNPIAVNGNIVNSSSSQQVINLGVSFGGGGATNFTFDGGSPGMIVGGGLTNAFGAPGFTTLTLAGTGILTNLLNSSTSPGGTNIILLNSSTANWTLADNATATAMTVPWDFQINNGIFNFGSGASAPTLTSTSAQGLPQDNQVGNTSGQTATLNMNAGTWTTAARLNLALANNSTGIVNQVGGTLNIGSQLQGANGGTTNAMSILNISGGTLNVGGGAGTLYVASRDEGSLTVTNTGAVNCGNLDVSRNANGNTRGSAGVVNLNGGTLTAGLVGTAVANSQAGPPSSGVTPSATFNFNGGILKATTNAAPFFRGSIVAPVIPITTIVKSGGAIIDDGGFAISVMEPLQHDSSLGGTSDGGLFKKGSGTLTLTAASTYTGNTLVSNGTLFVSGSLGATAVTVANNATLAGTGTVGGNVTVNAGGSLAPAGVGAIGTLTLNGNLGLQGNVLADINASTLANDIVLLNTGTVTYGGALTVTNLAGTPALGNSFRLFNAAGYAGSFSATNLPTLGLGLAWNWNPANGTLSVVSGVSTTPTNITVVVGSGTMTLSWPTDHTGWRLQAQTNSTGTGLSTNWSTVPGSTSVNSVMVPLNPANPTVFYRMVYP